MIIQIQHQVYPTATPETSTPPTAPSNHHVQPSKPLCSALRGRLWVVKLLLYYNLPQKPNLALSLRAVSRCRLIDWLVCNSEDVSSSTLHVFLLYTTNEITSGYMPYQSAIARPVRIDPTLKLAHIPLTVPRDDLQTPPHIIMLDHGWFDVSCAKV